MIPARAPAHTGAIIDTIDEFQVVECEPCGFKHVVPLPAPDQMEQLYRQAYYEKEKPGYIPGVVANLEWWNLVYGLRYDQFEQLLSSDRRRVLDVGSGAGAFLLQGRDRGWTAIGIEPAAPPVAHCRKLGLEVVEGFLTAATAETLGRFDVVHMNEVLEHIPEPKRLLEIAYRLLSPGGLLCVMVPNDYSPFQEALRHGGFPPWWVAPPHHLNYFDFLSLARLVGSTGFEIVSQEATFPIDLFLLMGDDYVRDRPVGTGCHARRMKFELSLQGAGKRDLLRKMYRALAGIGIGREIVLYARRNLR